MKRKLIISMTCLTLFCIPIIGCSESECTNNIVSEITSPDGKNVAYIFTRECGATTKISYQLSVLKKGDDPGNNKGNIYISYDSFSIEWNSSKIINVANSSHENFKQEKKVKDIEINYNYE